MVADGETVRAGGGKLVTPADNAAARASGVDLRGDFIAKSGFVGEDDPRGFERSVQRGSIDDGLAGFSAEDADLPFA